MKGEWIIKEVYFEEGFPKIIRDLKPETPYTTLTEREELSENPIGAAEQLPIGKTMTDRDLKPETPDTDFTDEQEILERFANLVAAHERERLADKFMEMHNAQKNRNNYFAFAARIIREEES